MLTFSMSFLKYVRTDGRHINAEEYRPVQYELEQQVLSRSYNGTYCAHFDCNAAAAGTLHHQTL